MNIISDYLRLSRKISKTVARYNPMRFPKFVKMGHGCQAIVA